MTTGQTRARRGENDEAMPAGLPPALRPWAQAFAGMPQAHLIVIGRLMAALAPLIDSQETALTSGLDELDSFDDIIASGPLDRLMMSELMWLKMMRGEFTRRVAEGEALRRRPVYRDPAGDRAVVVLLDNGVRMLGRRRLVALAALLTLGSSTLRRGDRFIWAATNHVGAAWQEGISRRALSRYVNQTGTQGLDDKTVGRLLNDAPIDVGSDRAILWTIAAKDTDLGDYVPRYRIEIDEQWPDAMTPGDGSGGSYRADVAVISQHRVRRTARFPLPDEQVCADTLRAPFRKTSPSDTRSRGATWAPDWISREADNGAAILRDSEGFVLFRHSRAPLRVDLEEHQSLLGIRWPGNGPGALALRQGDEIHVIRFDQAGNVLERGSTTLAADHPLIDGAHAASAVPPLLRLGRKIPFTLGAANGQVYDISMLSDSANSALSVALAEQVKDLRLLARARAWLLCDTERGGNRVFVLVHMRTGQRVFLRRDPTLDQARHIAGFEVIGETGGAFLHVDGAWRWYAPAWWAQSEQTTQLRIPADAFLLRVDPLHHARGAVLAHHSEVYPLGRRRWSALFWSQKRGLQEWRFASGHWAPYQRGSPNIDDRVTAMAAIGKDILARVVDDTGAISLLEFRIDSGRAPKVQTGPRWWEGATCVNH